VPNRAGRREPADLQKAKHPTHTSEPQRRRTNLIWRFSGGKLVFVMFTLPAVLRAAIGKHPPHPQANGICQRFYRTI
jgi:hypothetical protein